MMIGSGQKTEGRRPAQPASSRTSSEGEKLRIGSRVTDKYGRIGTIKELRHNVRATVVWDDQIETAKKLGLSKQASGVKKAHPMLKNLRLVP